jgi:hypothetical protein
MIGLPDFVSTQNTCPDDAATLLPVDPYTALRIHFGMLLGVDDFETEAAYHRGKMRLHNAWLHGHGVVWGLNVSADTASGEIRVERGLAQDLAGHELHLDAQACVSVGTWFDAHRNDAGFVFQETNNGNTVSFNAHVAMRFRACQARQVPALSDPCGGSQTSTAYSRVVETVELLLVPGQDPDPTNPPPPRPYHRLRLLFGLDDPVSGSAEDAAIVNARTAIEQQAGTDEPAGYLDALRNYAALDSADLTPATETETGMALLFPAPDDTPVVIGNVTGITLQKSGGAWQLATANASIAGRRTLIDTATIQELLCGPAFVAAAVGAAPPPPIPTGPQVSPASVSLSGQTITLSVTPALRMASVTQQAFAVTVFGATGWQSVAVDQAQLDGTGMLVTLTLHSTPAGDLLRLIAFGTGQTPLLGNDLTPLGGGTDFVHMITLTGGS